MWTWPRPFHLLDEWRKDFGHLWNEEPKMGFPFGKNGEWAPTMDVFRKDGKMVLEAELPGVEKDDVKLLFENGDLVVKGERREETEVDEGDYVRTERAVGAFYRRLPLPEGTVAEDIHATFENGVLKVEAPLPEEPETDVREIELN